MFNRDYKPYRLVLWKEANIELLDLDQIVFYDKPLVKFERLLETYLSYAPKGFRSFLMAMPIWLKEKLAEKKRAKEEAKQKLKEEKEEQL